MLFATLKRHYLLVIFEINTAFLSGYFPKTLMPSNLNFGGYSVEKAAKLYHHDFDPF